MLKGFLLPGASSKPRLLLPWFATTALNQMLENRPKPIFRTAEIDFSTHCVLPEADPLPTSTAPGAPQHNGVPIATTLRDILIQTFLAIRANVINN
jgi:hypothetical protein